MNILLDGLSAAASHQVAMEQLRLKAQRQAALKAPAASYQEWLRVCFPHLKLAESGERHDNLWRWVQKLERGVRPKPFIAIWPRGSGKSSTAEFATAFTGAEGLRRYGWYISGTQALADMHVESIAALIETPAFARYYPRMAERAIGKFGSQKGWRRNRLRCGNGFTIDARGLDIGSRGGKLEEQRPDFIILDDIDELFSSEAVVQKRIDTITSSILPAGSGDVAILGVQNMIRDGGFFGRIHSGEADYLLNVTLDGPHPAVHGMETEYVEGEGIRITAGTASWPQGQSIETCEMQINDWGLSSFKREAQHEVSNLGSLFAQIEFRRIPLQTYLDTVDPIRTIVSVDPAVTSTDTSDSHGIAVGSVTADGTVYMVETYEKVMTPTSSLRKSIELAVKYGAREVHVEVNNGGSLFEQLYDRIIEDMIAEGALTAKLAPRFYDFRATAAMGGKVERATVMLGGYERRSITHIEEHTADLEAAQLRFPQRKPFDLVDAAVHAHRILAEGPTRLFY